MMDWKISGITYDDHNKSRSELEFTQFGSRLHGN